METKNLLVLVAILAVSGCAGTQNLTAEYTDVYSVDVDSQNRQEVMQTISVVQTRLNQREVPSAVSIVNDSEGEWKIAIRSSGNASVVRSTLQDHEINASLPVQVEGERYYNISKSHLLNSTGDSIRVDGEGYETGQTGEIENTSFRVIRTGDVSRIEVLAYDNDDIRNVLSSQIRTRGSGGGYTASLPIVITDESAERLNRMAKNYDDEEEWLKHQNGSYVDMILRMSGERTELRLATAFQRQIVQNPTISFSSETEKGLEQKINLYESQIVSGRLPVDLKLESTERIEDES